MLFRVLYMFSKCILVEILFVPCSKPSKNEVAVVQIEEVAQDKHKISRNIANYKFLALLTFEASQLVYYYNVKPLHQINAKEEERNNHQQSLQVIQNTLLTIFE